MSGGNVPVPLVRVSRLVKAPLVAIVDDDDDMRDALSDLLLVLGLSVRAFDRADALLAAYETDAFDCVITDLRMPGIDGLDLLTRLQALDASVRVIVVTSDTDPRTRARAIDAGAHVLLTKPLEDRVLIAHLASVLGRDLLAGRW